MLTCHTSHFLFDDMSAHSNLWLDQSERILGSGHMSPFLQGKGFPMATYVTFLQEQGFPMGTYVIFPSRETIPTPFTLPFAPQEKIFLAKRYRRHFRITFTLVISLLPIYLARKYLELFLIYKLRSIISSINIPCIYTIQKTFDNRIQPLCLVVC